MAAGQRGSCLSQTQWNSLNPTDKLLTICSLMDISIGERRHKLLMAASLRVTVAFLRLWQSTLRGQVAGDVCWQIHLIWNRETYFVTRYWALWHSFILTTKCRPHRQILWITNSRPCWVKLRMKSTVAQCLAVAGGSWVQISAGGKSFCVRFSGFYQVLLFPRPVKNKNVWLISLSVPLTVSRLRS